MSSKRGTHPASLANLEKGRKDLTVHGWWSKGIQTTGVSTKGGCPLSLLGNCECDLPDGEQCPVMLQEFVNRVVELQKLGLSKHGAELITRLEFQSMLGHYILDRQGAFRSGGENGKPVKVHGVWIAVGTVNHALERLYRVAGILRIGQLPAPSLEEYLEQRARKGESGSE